MKLKYTRPVNISSKAAWIVIFCNSALHFFIFYGDLHTIINIAYLPTVYIPGTVFQGLLFLSFPLLGLLADVWLNRFRVLCIGMIAVAVAMFVFCILGAVSDAPIDATPVQLTAVVPLLIGMIGEGMFEANAIQFGTDQLVDAPSQELSAMVHWYCWSTFLCRIAVYYSTISTLVYCSNSFCLPHKLVLYVAVFGILLSTVCVIIFLIQKKTYNIIAAGKNPIKPVYQVLKYAIKNKYPKLRRASTYCDDKIPSRLDFASKDFGGPYPKEQVEDTRAFLWITLLLCSLIGFNLKGDTFSLAHKLQEAGLPSKLNCIMFGFDPNNIMHLTIVLVIPIYQLIVLPLTRNYSPSMVKRMGIGLVCSFLSVLMSIIIKASIKHHGNMHPECSVYILSTFNKTIPDSDFIYPALFIPQFLNGLSYFFVFVTALEFICAQAPQTMKGMLIGLWYALISVDYFFIGLFDVLILHEWTVTDTGWYLYQAFKGFCILVSFLCFVAVSKRYKYRVRGDPGYRQAIIEDIYTRYLERQEIARQERQLLARNMATINYTQL